MVNHTNSKAECINFLKVLNKTCLFNIKVQKSAICGFFVFLGEKYLMFDNQHMYPKLLCYHATSLRFRNQI
jgi:hypothetical protein